MARFAMGIPAGVVPARGDGGVRVESVQVPSGPQIVEHKLVQW
jgi:hypothetical protein